LNLKARAVVAAFNNIGCDAVTIGENDLLFGKKELLEIMKGAEFPAVSSNLVDARSGAELFEPYIIKRVDGLRVGIFGLFPEIQGGEGDRFRGLAVLDPFRTARRMVSTLTEKTDFVILLSHLGYTRDLELARKVGGINVIVGGRSGINLSYPRIIGRTMVLHVGKKGRYLGRVDIALRDPSRPFVNVTTRAMLRDRLQHIETQLKALARQPLQNPAETRRRREVLESRRVETERIIGLYQGYNEIRNRIVPLVDSVPGDAECGEILKPYLEQISAAEKASSPRAARSEGAAGNKSE